MVVTTSWMMEDLSKGGATQPIAPSRDFYHRDVTESQIACLRPGGEPPADGSIRSVQRLKSAPTSLQAAAGISTKDMTVIAGGMKVTPQDAQRANPACGSGRRHFASTPAVGVPGMQGDSSSLRSPRTRGSSHGAGSAPVVPPFGLHDQSSSMVEPDSFATPWQSPRQRRTMSPESALVVPPFPLHTPSPGQSKASPPSTLTTPRGSIAGPASGQLISPRGEDGRLLSARSARAASSVDSLWQQPWPAKARCRHLQPSRGLWRDLPVYEVGPDGGSYLSRTGALEEHAASAQVLSDPPVGFEFTPRDRGASSQSFAGMRTTQKSVDALGATLSPRDPLGSAREHRTRYSQEMHTDPLLRAGCRRAEGEEEEPTRAKVEPPEVCALGKILMQDFEGEDTTGAASCRRSKEQASTASKEVATPAAGAHFRNGLLALDLSKVKRQQPDEAAESSAIASEEIHVAANHARVLDRRRDMGCPVRSKTDPERTQRKKQADMSIHPTTLRDSRGMPARFTASKAGAAGGRCSPNSTLLSPRQPTLAGMSSLCTRMTQSPLGPALRKRSGAMTAR